MKLASLLLLGALGLMAQTSPAPPANPLVTTSKGTFAIAKSSIIRSVDKIPDNLWSYRPVETVRTVSEMFAHIADGQYEFCAPAKGESVDKQVEKTKKSKADIVAALKEAFAYCDAVFAGMTDATAAQTVNFFGSQRSRLGIMEFNTAHTMEHYGNLVTYMRMNKIVPPTTAGGN